MKFNFLLIFVFVSIIVYAGIDSLHGIVGLTKRDGSTGCVCHNFFWSDSVNVWIEGPDSVYRNDTVSYKLFMSGGPEVTGGFNVASYFGVLDSVDTLTRVAFGELTHTSPNPFISDTVFWNFSYTAPDSLLIDTLYSVGNSTNGDSIPTDPDQWNFGENFIVNVIDKPVNVERINLVPEEYILYQNYPNPFNPTTKIKFSISDLPDGKAGFRFVSLIVYDVLGNEVAILINEEKPAGEYEVEFSAEGLKSGIYFYRIQVGDFDQTKKMILLR
jgi:hypothetical protein